jgi:primase-polymerase (primpol)-like protein
VDIYSIARYFTVTGNIHGATNGIADRTAELQQIHDKYLLPEAPRVVSSSTFEAPPQATLETLRRGITKDPVLRACWNGEQRRGDESASDQALMNKLAYWCNANVPAMLAAFMQSPYFAQKDEAHQRKCRRADYLPNTATAACSTLHSTAEQDTARFNQTKKHRNEAR